VLNLPNLQADVFLSIYMLASRKSLLANKDFISLWSRIVRVSVVLRRTVCGYIDWHFDNLSHTSCYHQHSDDAFCSGCQNVSQMNVTTNIPSHDYTHPDDHTSTVTYDTCMTPGFKNSQLRLNQWRKNYIGNCLKLLGYQWVNWILKTSINIKLLTGSLYGFISGNAAGVHDNLTVFHLLTQ